VEHYDVLVIGCGAMGSSTSYNLAKKGMKSLTLEQFDLNHPFGSSHGRTRIFRTAYYEDARYVPLLKRARALWEELQADSGRRILELTGGLMIGDQDSTLVLGASQSAKLHGLDHEVLSASEAMSRFPAFKLGEELTALYEPAAGVLFPEECITAFVSLAQGRGAEFSFNETVVGWHKEAGGLRVQTSKGSYLADKVVVAAGAWAAKLLPGTLDLSCERQVPFWFRPKTGGSHSSHSMPIFILQEGRHMYYGIPDFGDGVKAAVHHEGRIGDVEAMERMVTPEDETPVVDFVRRHLPGVEERPISSTTCVYTNTRDENFVIDDVSSNEDVLLVSACSGHGFKFSSAIGEAVAELVSTGRTTQDIGFLKLGRFAPSRS